MTSFRATLIRDLDRAYVRNALEKKDSEPAKPADVFLGVGRPVAPEGYICVPEGAKLAEKPAE